MAPLFHAQNDYVYSTWMPDSMHQIMNQSRLDDSCASCAMMSSQCRKNGNQKAQVNILHD
jgi:hypothetical protein